MLIVVYVIIICILYKDKAIVLWQTDNAMAATRSLMKRADTSLSKLTNDGVATYLT